MFFVLFLCPFFWQIMGFLLVIMLLHMLLFGDYAAFGYALFFGVTYAP